MPAKRLRFSPIFAALFLAFLPSLYAETNEDAARFSGELRFHQRLTWSTDRYAFRYEVVIERQDDEGVYHEFVRESRNTYFLEVSLPEGNYRYQVIVYDFLNRNGGESPWLSFSINPAFDPESPFVQRFSWIADQYARYYEIEIEKETQTRGRFVGMQQEFTPRNFVEATLLPGRYRYRITPYDFLDNPGEVSEWGYIDVANSTLYGEINLRYTFDFYGALAWMPHFPLYGLNPDEDALAASGVRIRLAAPLWNPINVGLELVASMTSFQSVQLPSIDFNVLAWKWLPGDRLAFTVRVGGGVMPVTEQTASGGNAGTDGISRSTHVFTINTGASVLWLLSRHIYMEAGLDTINHAGSNEFGRFRPWIASGMRY